MLKKFLAEFAGTFLLVLFGTGAIVLDRVYGNVTHAGISLTFGLSVWLMIMLFGKISGSHINPAVTVSMALFRKFPWREVPFYIIAQMAGAAAASFLLRALYPQATPFGATLPRGSEMESLLLETLLSFILLLGVLLTESSRPFAKIPYIALVAGTIVGLEAFLGGPVCGASMNPARSFGPALASGDFGVYWLYVLGPVAGMFAAAFLWKTLIRKAN